MEERLAAAGGDVAFWTCWLRDMGAFLLQRARGDAFPRKLQKKEGFRRSLEESFSGSLRRAQSEN